MPTEEEPVPVPNKWEVPEANKGAIVLACAGEVILGGYEGPPGCFNFIFQSGFGIRTETQSGRFYLISPNEIQSQVAELRAALAAAEAELAAKVALLEAAVLAIPPD
jgi:hypothetical protein